MFDINTKLRANIASLKSYSSARDEYKDASSDMIFIDANENPFNTNVNRYPDPQQSVLKARISKLKHVSTDQMLLGNGSDEVLDLIFRAFCEPNKDNVIILPPTYGMYAVLANLNAVEIREVLLSEDFQPKVENILNIADSHSKILFICSPNNPTANSIHADKVEMLLKNFEGIVLIDEAYIDFSDEESWIQRLSHFPNLIVTQTLSKAYGLAGIRLGICYASTEIIAVLNKIKPPYNVNQLTQLRALERLNELDSVAFEIDTILKERERLLEGFNTLSIIEQVYPSDANFILAKVDDANLRYQELISEGIVVRNRDNQPLCKNCLRFTIGRPQENDILLNALKALQ